MIPEAFFVVWSGALGAILGSFANVCIHRLPRGESVVTPRSRCPRCGHAIAFYDNVPVLSWLLLKGRCRSCRGAIAVRYPIIEALNAGLFVAIALTWGISGRTAIGFVLATSCVVLVATDLVHRILPDEVTLGGAALVGVIAVVRDVLLVLSGGTLSVRTSATADALAGAAIGAGLLLLVREVYFRVRKAEGMGLGDVKMMLLVGAATGLFGVLPALFFAALAGALLGLALIAVRVVRFRILAAGAKRKDASLAASSGLLLDAEGRIVAAGRVFRSIPGAPGPGESFLHARGAVRPLAAFSRCARRRARRHLVSSTDRLFLEEEEFFRVLSVRAEPLQDGGLLLLLGRADIPFGVFLALGALASYALGPAALAFLMRLAGRFSF